MWAKHSGSRQHGIFDRLRRRWRTARGGAAAMLLFLGACTARGALPSLDLSGMSRSILAAADAPAIAPPAAELVFFTAPGCLWCERLRREVLADPDVLAVLDSLALTEIDVSRYPERAAALQISQVPVIIVQLADGTVLGRINGWLPAAAFHQQLKQILAGTAPPAPATDADADARGLLKALDQLDELSPEQWRRALALLGQPQHRRAVRERLIRLAPFPRAAVVEQLTDARLAVRLGALDILEEIRGDSLGFDPWAVAPDQWSQSMARWRAWATDTAAATGAAGVVYAALTEEQALGYIRDVLSDQPERARRARRMLEAGGGGVVDLLSRFLQEQADLPPGLLNRLRETRYTIMMPPDLPVRASVMAHRLVSGAVDDRLKALTELGQRGHPAIPVLREFLDDDLPLIRETAAEALLKADGYSVLPIIAERLRTEKNTDVIHTILRSLGTVRYTSTLPLITPFFTHADEDLVIIALNTAGRLRFPTVAPEIKAALWDSSWRIRVAALDALATMARRGSDGVVADSTRRGWLPAVEACLNDADDFVRFSAVRTIAALGVDPEQTVQILEKYYLQDDALKGPIAAAVSSLDRPWPASFGPALNGKSVDVVLPVLEAAQQGGVRALPIVAQFAEHEHPDLACAALRVLAAKGMSDAIYRAILVRALETTQRDRITTVLRHLRLQDDSFEPMFMEEEEYFIAEPEDGGLHALFDAFLPEPEPEPQADAQAPAPQAVDVFAAFLGSDPDSESAAQRADNRHLLAAARQHLTGDAEVRFLAALALLRLQDESGLAALIGDISERDVEDRLDVARQLTSRHGQQALTVIKLLLRDPSAHVRRSAASAAMQVNKGSAGLRIVLEELERPGTPLLAPECFSHATVQVLQQSGARREAGTWARRILASEADAAVRVFALICLEHIWRRGDDALVEPLLQDANVWTRRAAARTLAAIDRDGLRDRAAVIMNDASEHVRIVVPISLAPEQINWQHRFNDHDADRQSTSHHHMSFSQQPTGMPSWIGDLLKKSLADPAPAVRFEAWMSLLNYRQPVDLGAMAAMLHAFNRPDWNRRVSDFMRANADQLGSSFRILMPFVERSRIDKNSLLKLRQRFNLTTATEEAVLPPISSRTAPDDAAPTAIVADFIPAAAPTPIAADHPLTIVYFRSIGCRQCEELETWWPALQQAFPTLNIETFDMHKIEAMRLNEALSERFNVPERVRMVTPAVFSGAGYVIQRDVSFAAVVDLLSRSAAIPLDAWRPMPDAEIATVDARIETRYRTRFGLGVVLAAGLLDGINPCAFATIIFFLSYMQISRRRRPEMLRVCLAFIAGVFIAYFALGLGLTEVVARFDILRRLGNWLNWALAALALVIMLMNFRDAILCLQGRMAEMTMQLPTALKDGIHVTIRRGARHTRFVIAAFGVGIMVSVLELACTGQVYLPTIVFMLQSADGRSGAILYLLLYNLAFIAPLVLILVLGLFGLRQQSMIQRMHRHAAAVKFATAALFLLLFLFFAFGNHWLGALATGN